MLIYRIALSLFALPLSLMLVLRVLRSQESREDVRERLGGGTVPALGAGSTLWVHAASNGELTSARQLLTTLLDRDPRLEAVVTANTESGRALMSGWGLERVSARLAPLDFRWAIRRFLGTWQPLALISLENELWPNRMAMAKSADIPVLLAGARMSKSSAERWRRYNWIAPDALDLIDYAAAQDEASKSRLRKAGLAAERLGPILNLKTDPTDPEVPEEVLSLSRVFRRGETLLAASTHEGEEIVVARAFAMARQARRKLKLIIAPRHPRRSREIEAELVAAGFAVEVRSRDGAPSADCDIYLADTLGEMGLWYTLSAVTFVGGSLIDKGGHTPFEPAAADSIVLHGPFVSNFAEVYAALDAAEGAIPIQGVEDLARTFVSLELEGYRDDTAGAARRALAAYRETAGGLEPFMTKLAELARHPALAPPEGKARDDSPRQLAL